MNLRAYLKSKGLTHGAFAALIGAAGPRTVHRYVTGDRIPRPHIMQKITEVTGGLVTAADFYAAPAAPINAGNGCAAAPPDHPAPQPAGG